MAASSSPITETELETLFAVALERTTDAEQWLDMSDPAADWSDANVRRGVFRSLVAAGATKRLEAAGHVFTFADGSSVTVTRHGVSF